MASHEDIRAWYKEERAATPESRELTRLWRRAVALRMTGKCGMVELFDLMEAPVATPTNLIERVRVFVRDHEARVNAETVHTHGHAN